MKIKIKALLHRLIMWAAAADIELQIHRRVSAAERILSDVIAMKAKTLDLGNRAQWGDLRSQIAALQAIDVPFGKYLGKIVIVARVHGQDIVKIIDIPPNMETRDYKELVEELQARYGARPEFLDAPAGKRTFMAEYLGMTDAATLRAVARDRGFMQ